jgi:hypothetical protein
MKRLVVASLVMVSLAFVLVVSAPAQQGGSGSGGGMTGRSQWMYDPSKAETVSGEVVAVKDFTSRNGVRKGIGLELNTGNQNILVHLGPQFYVDQQAVKIAAGDKVEITAVKSLRRGHEVLIAGEVRKDGQVLKLRDEKGEPLWAGSGPGGGRRH